MCLAYNQRWKRECQFLIDCQALNQIKSNPKSILSKLTLWGQTLQKNFHIYLGFPIIKCQKVGLK